MADRLSQTKSRLFELTAKALQGKPTGKGISSADVVAELMKDIKSIPSSEQTEITRVGLMVLAGRVTTMNKSDVAQLDIFQKEKFPLFVDLRLTDESGRYRSRRFDVKKLTPNVIAQHVPAMPKNKSGSKRDNLIGWAKRRIADGFGDVPVESSHERQ